MFTSAQNMALVRTELDALFYQKFQYAQFPGHATAETSDIFKPVQVSGAEYFEEVFKGASLAKITGESQVVGLSTPKIDYKKTITIKDFTDSVELTKNLFDDGKFNVYSEMIADLASKARRTRDINAFRVFRNAFTTELTADGQPFVSAAHPLIGGGTQSNLLTGPLNTVNWNLAVVSLMQQRDHAGVIMSQLPKLLLVPPALWETATQILDSELQADTANNNINVWRSAMGVMVMTSVDISAAAGGSDTAWFVLSENHSVKRYIRQGVETSMREWGQSNNRTYLYQYNFREEVSVIDHIGVAGSTGL